MQQYAVMLFSVLVARTAETSRAIDLSVSGGAVTEVSIAFLSF